MEQEKKTKRQQQAENTKNRIADVVKALSKTNSLDKIKMVEICKEADISLGAFYQYFSCKEDAMVYCYQVIDQYWETLNVESIQNPYERMKAIIDMHLQSICDEPLCFISQLYLSQIKIYDSYFFEENRYLHKVLTNTIKECQEQDICTTKYTAYEICMKLLNFSRGLVYNYCIRHEEKSEEWLKFARNEQEEYQSLFFRNK